MGPLSQWCSRVFVFLVMTTVAWGQAGVSTVRGTVRDIGEAIIPGAQVVLTNTATGVARETSTNDAGLYVIPGVTPGPYRIKVDFAGLRSFEGSLTVQVQQDAVVDVKMEVATAATRLEVVDVTPLVKTDSPTLGQVLERKRIEQLPINGRGYQAFLAAVPGITATGRIRAYGQPIGTHTLLFDGTAMNEVWEGWDIGRTPGLDAVEEFKVEVNASSAKFTRPTTIVLSSRSGTNEFHGAMFYTNRNSGYGVARQRQDNYTKPPYLNRNEYGVSGGGPVIIPRLYNGRNRTFFFFAWEAQKFYRSTTARFHVPTAAMRNGDFSGLVDAQGRRINIFDPLTTDANWNRTQFAYRGVPNTIDPARMSPTAKYLFSVTPLPTNPNINPLIDANWIGPSPRMDEQDTKSIRIDHRFSDKDLMYARYSRGTNYQEYPYPQQIMLDYLSSVTNRWWPNDAVSVNWIRTIGPTLTNEVNLTFTRDYQRRGTGDYQTDYTRTLLGLPNPFNAPNFPTVNGLNLGPDNTYEYGGDGIFYLISNYVTLQDNATKIHGKHEFQFGFQYRMEDIPKSVVPLAGGFSASTQATALYDPASQAANPIATPLTGNNVANLYLGVLNYTAQYRRPWLYMRRQEYAGYFQDNWKATPRMTLNLGLRYEFRTPIYDRNDSLLSFDLDRKAYVIGTDLQRFTELGATLPSIVQAFQSFGGKIITAEEAGLPKNLVYNNWRNFGPRLGFAYRALDGNKEFVIRSGYRLSYYTQPISRWFNGSQVNPQLVGSNFQYSVTNTALSPDGLPNYGLRSAPTYIAGLNTGDDVINFNDTRTITRGFNATHLNPHLPDPRVHDWNFTIEKQIMASTVFRAAYVGNAARKQQQTIQMNNATPDYIWYATRKVPLPIGEFSGVATRPYDQQVYGTVDRYDMIGYSNHHGFQLELERRYNNGVGFQVFWVTGNTLWSGSGVDSNTVLDTNQFLPGAVPAEVSARNAFLNYGRDPNTPKNQIRWNWIVDLPFGNGKKFANSSGWLNKIVGGWQVAGLGNWVTSYWSLPTSIYPNGNPMEIYGDKYPIEDCRSGACFPGYLYWNGYIPRHQINSRDAQGRPNGVMGVPENYRPAAAPLIPWGSTTLPANAPANTNLSQFWDTNTVWLPLNNGPAQRVTLVASGSSANDNLHPWRNQYMNGIGQWFLDASLFKFTNLTEKVTLRFNVDFFNVLNNPNNPTSISADGIHSTRNSGSAARVTQLTVRLMW